MEIWELLALVTPLWVIAYKLQDIYEQLKKK